MPASRVAALTVVGDDGEEELGLTPQQEIYALERSKGATLKEASALAKVSTRQGNRWEHLPQVAEKVQELQLQVQTEVLRIFRANARLAAHRIVECISPGPATMTAVAAINLKAAEMTLKYAGLEPEQKQRVEGNVRQTYVIERAVYSDDAGA